MKLKKLVQSMDPADIERMARLAKTTPDQLRFQLAGGHRRPGFQLAVRLVRASRKMYPDQPRRWLKLTEWFSEDALA
jgi:hypothetical protein